MPLSLARKIATDALTNVLERNHGAKAALAAAWAHTPKNVHPSERNFSQELLYGTLRWFMRLGYHIQEVSGYNFVKLDAPVRDALLVAFYQHYFLSSIPKRAYVYEAVEYVRRNGFHSAAGFVNATLRKLPSRACIPELPPMEATARLGLQHGHPRWLTKRWLDRFPHDTVVEILKANNTPPVHDLRINTLHWPLEDLKILQELLMETEGMKAHPRPLPGCLRVDRVPRTGPGSLFSQGLFTIQGESSQLISHLVAPSRKGLYLDACVGPAGKLCHLATLAPSGSVFMGVDPNRKQLERAQVTWKRMACDKELHLACDDFLDLTLEAMPQQPCKILLDAPCSALGILRAHPEARFTKMESTITELSALQQKLIEHAWNLLPNGGELIYSVCSFEPEEGGHHLTRSLASLAGARPITLESRIPRNYHKFLKTPYHLEILPTLRQGGLDGFTAFALKKQLS